jgi:single-stranded-DNA-specific exonuclease
MTDVTQKTVWRVMEENRSRTSELSKSLEIPRLVAQLLVSRGISDFDACKAFLEPSAKDLADPFSLTDMDKAVKRLKQARDARERALVFGDYDVDGIAGAAILTNALRRFGMTEVSYAMPSRLTQGYGIAPEHVETAHKDGVSIIVTVDNGINARSAAETARRLGVDFIITDHHQLEGDLPDALAVINPKRQTPDHPCWPICGAAVAFNVARALTNEIADLDLAALGTVADVMPLRGQNRVLVFLGLREITKNPRVGVEQLAKVAAININDITAERIAFALAPRINAAGRLGNGMIPLELLLTESQQDAAQMASELNRANEERRLIEKKITDEAIEEIEAMTRSTRSALVLSREGWHPGVIGIVAAKLQSLYNLPVVLLAINGDGIARGSGRSTDDFDMVDALSACKEHIVRFGGHNAAAGLTILQERIPEFQAAFEAESMRRLANAPKTRALNIDALIGLSEIDAQFVRALDRLEPFGSMNPSPVFCSCGVTPLPHSLRELRGGHARFTVQQDSRMFEAIGFGMAGMLQQTLGSRPVDIAFTPKLNTWRGETTVQLVLKDIRDKGIIESAGPV